MLFAGLRSVRMVKNCDLGLENAALGHSFSPYGPPSRQITYMYSENNAFRAGSSLATLPIDFAPAETNKKRRKDGMPDGFNQSYHHGHIPLQVH